MTNATDTDTTEIKDANGTTVMKVITSYAESYQFALLEVLRVEAAASLQLEDATEGETTNATEAVDTNLNCHVILLCRVALARFGTPGHCLPTVATVMPTLYTWQRFSVRFG